MPLIAGLGNPGREYEKTRHNVGFMIADELASRHGWSWKMGKGKYILAQGKLSGNSVWLIKPTTYMNLSGSALQHAMAYYKIPLEEVLVCTDDIHLDVAKIRIRGAGSSGGHNGLSHIQHVLGTREYARLRFGVGNDFYSGTQADYVLSPFPSAEKTLVKEGIQRAADAVECYILRGCTEAMNRFN